LHFQLGAGAGSFDWLARYPKFVPAEENTPEPVQDSAELNNDTK
jgi:hypothetical protein